MLKNFSEFSRRIFSYLQYLQDNFLKIVAAVAIAFFLVYLVKPNELMLNLGLSFSLSLIIFSLLKLIQKYLHNFKLTKIPFTVLDFGLWILLAGLVIWRGTPQFTKILVNFVVENFFNPVILRKINGLIEFGLFIFLGAFCAWMSKSQEKSHLSKKPAIEQDRLLPLSDDPIEFNEDDLLGREKFIDDFYQTITTYAKNNSSSMVFSLNGSWGEGKTSALNLLGGALEKNEKIIVYKFNPWNFSSSEQLIESFYEGLSETLNQYYFLPNLKKLFTRYRKILSSCVKLTGLNLDLDFGEENIDQLHDKINQWISYTQKTIVVMLDDLDRLTREELLEVFKLVKLSARFNNFIFILSYDPLIIYKLQKENLNIDPEFLEKIVQMPIPLPKITPKDISNYLNSKLKEFMTTNLGIIEEEYIEEILKDLQRICFKYQGILFPTLRSVKRYLNGLMVNLPPLKLKVNIGYFLLLELLRIFYPKIYEDIWQNNIYYLPIADNSPNFLRFLDEARQNEYRLNHINSLLEKTFNREVIQEIIMQLFPLMSNALNSWKKKDINLKQYLKEKHISHQKYFFRYFVFKTNAEIQFTTKEYMSYLINELLNLHPEQAYKQTIIEIRNFTKFGKISMFFYSLQKHFKEINSQSQEKIIFAITRSTKNYGLDYTDQAIKFIVETITNIDDEQNFALDTEKILQEEYSSLYFAFRIFESFQNKYPKEITALLIQRIERTIRDRINIYNNDRMPSSYVSKIIKFYKEKRPNDETMVNNYLELYKIKLS